MDKGELSRTKGAEQLKARLRKSDVIEANSGKQNEKTEVVGVGELTSADRSVLRLRVIYRL